MAVVIEQVSIRRSPEEVWAALSDFGEISRWAPNVEHSCLMTDQLDGVGAVRRVQVGRNALVERVVEWDEDRHLSYEIDGMPPVVRSVTNSWRLDGSGDATTVSLTSHVDTGPRPPQQLVARVVGRLLAKASREMLGGLKHHLEEDSP